MLRHLFVGPIYEREGLLCHTAEVRRWWEARRWFYNKVVGGAGLVTCILMISCAVISEPIVGEPIGLPDPLILAPLAIVVYAIAANIFYTGGWIAELVLARIPNRAGSNAFGVRAFRIGLKFSIGLTVFPAVLCWAAFLFSLATGNHASDAH